MSGKKTMDYFCGSPYWNSTLAWEVDTPDLTACFENTALAWAPCLFLWIFSPLELYYIHASKRKNIPWGWRSLSKLAITAAIIVLAAIDLGKAIRDNANGMDVYRVSYFTPSFQIVSFALTAVFVYYNRVAGLRTSGLLTIFWFLTMALGIPRYRTELMHESNERSEGDRLQLPFIVAMIYLPLVIVMFILNCFADAQPTECEYSKSPRPCPEHSASFLSRLFFFWFDPMAWKGYRSDLEKEDLFDLQMEETCGQVVPMFDKHWGHSKKETQKNNKGAEKVKISVFPALMKSFGGTFFFAAVMELSANLLNFVNPQILKLLISYSQSSDPVWKGVLYAVALLVTSLLQNMLLAQFNYRMSRVGIRIHAALTSTVYRKALTISSSAKKESTVGEIVNLMAVDAQRFLDLGGYVTMLWSAPIQIIIALFFLYSTLGVAVLAGLASMLLLIPINSVIAVKMKNLQVAQLKNKDDRVKLMNEVLNGMKVLKLYAWEIPFAKKILNVRERELNKLKTGALLQAAISFTFSVAPFMVTLVSFATYVLIDPENNILTAEKAFVALSLFNIMQLPLALLPMAILMVIQAGVSVKRIDKFMNSDDLNPYNVSHDKSEAAPIVIEKGTFAWSTDEPSVLVDINLRVDSGKLVAVVGTVGSGKSSLLSAMLGEMEKLSGRVNTKGSIAYVPQQAWIQNATVKENILFGKPIDNNLYVRAIHSCALKSDLDILTAGDETEIGEKGINLSGGQKQRVSIARAVYNDADVYLFDDPLSAVDSHVGKHIFENVIGPQGLLQNKTRVLVTHGISFLKEADLVVVLKDGQVSEKGSYEELLRKKGAFAEFLMQHLRESAEEEEGFEELSALQAELEKTVGRAEIQRQLSTISYHSGSKGGSTSGSIRRARSPNSSLRRRASKTSHTSEKVEDKLIEDESREKGSVKITVYLTFLRSVGVLASVATIVLHGIFEGLAIGGNLWLSRWTDDKDTNNVSSPDFIPKRNMYLGVYGAFGLSQAVFSMAAAFIFFLSCIVASGNLHLSMFQRIIRCPMSFFDTTPTGRILNRFAKDVDVVDNVLPGLLHGALWMIISAMGVLFTISYSTPIFLSIVVPVGAFYYVVQRFYVSTTRQLKRLEAVSRSPIYSHFSETISGAASIRAFGHSERFTNEVYRRVDVNQTCYFPVAVANRWSAIRLETVGTVVTFFAALFAVFGRGNLAAGIVGVSVTYALQITQSLNYLVQLTSDVENNIVSVERLKEYGETPQEADWDDSADYSVEKCWPKEGKVEFRNYEIRYRDGLDLVLKGINFVVNGGEKVGIVGRTGAGKSSLTLGLFRIVEPAAGQILIDGTDISKLGLQTLRSRITIIPQDPVLFSGSLRLNVDPFGQFTDDQLWRVMESAHLKTLVKGFAAGLDHEISEGGENLSVGQRQLVCLARALLRKTKVLVFDEATAAVDLETDDLIQKTIRNDFKDCTILTIAHRLNTIIDSDKVLVLDQGRVKEFEPPQVLLQRRDSMFYSLAKDAGLV